MLEERLHSIRATRPEEQRKQIKTIQQETMDEVDDLSIRKHRDWFDEADKGIHECLKRNTSATIVYLQT